jgi:propionyl-CoA carboxylase alpha chain
MIKAAAGGGGKGLRIAHGKAEVAEGFLRARSEARSSFGDDRVFIERYVENPRHIEIQVLGDRHGNVVHLGERECSIQRRNQKIVEESPSPAVDAALRETMGAEAVALAKAVGYDSAGTVEFIMGQDRSFYFLEMNTRLQVEHPVTEFVTGLDLVEQMIRVAAGEKLAFTQKDVRLDGWAIETRLCAEDPRRNFMPSIGRLTRYRPPAEGRDGAATLRIDAGVEEDSEISVYFDPLMAKVVTHASGRADAVRAMGRALDRFVIDGVAHNAGLLSAIMSNPRWQEGRLSTGFIDEEFPGGFSASPGDAETLTRLARVALAVELRYRAKFRTMRGRLNGEGSTWRSDWVVTIGGSRLALRASPVSGSSFAVDVAVDGGEPVTVASSWAPGDVLWSGTAGGEAMLVQVRPTTGGYLLSSGGVEISARVLTPKVAALDALMSAKRPADTFRLLRCPMPGVVLEIAVEPGHDVRAGEPLAVVEAMKMQNVLRAERDAKVKRIAVKAGDTLAVDAVIMEFE